MKRLVEMNSLQLPAVFLLAFSLAGCGRDDVKVYHVATNDLPQILPASTAPMALPDGLDVPDNSLHPELKYVLPEGWKEKPLTQMRAASFDVSEAGKEADVSVISLSGTSGGGVANVNRWRGQVGLAPLAETEIPPLAERVVAAGQPADLYDLVGTNSDSGAAVRMLGVILPGGDAVWYFKMLGDATLVEKQKPAFVAFLKSVELGSPAGPAAMDLSQLPPSHPPIAGLASGPSAAIPAAVAHPAWTGPADWQAGPLAQFLVARFVIGGSSAASAAVNVSQLSGDGGGLLANVNRWGQQLGQPPISEADAAKLPTLEVSGVKAVIADFTGTDPKTGQPARLVGVVLPQAGQTWFYKLMGDPAVVARQKDALFQFIQSAK